MQHHLCSQLSVSLFNRIYDTKQSKVFPIVVREVALMANPEM